MEMIKSRNKTSHTYNKAVAEEIVSKIKNEYLSSFIELESVMKNFLDKK